MNFWERAARLPIIRFFVNSKTVLALVLKCLLTFVIAYAWVWIAGFVFETVFNVRATTVALVVFIVLCVLAAIAVFLTTWAIVRFVQGKDGTEKIEKKPQAVVEAKKYNCPQCGAELKKKNVKDTSGKKVGEEYSCEQCGVVFRKEELESVANETGDENPQGDKTEQEDETVQGKENNEGTEATLNEAEEING